MAMETKATETRAAPQQQSLSRILFGDTGPAPRRRHGGTGNAIFGSAMEALQANRLRSFLTMLGMIIGVSAVIAVVTLTQGVNENVSQRFAALGTNVLTIAPGATSSRGAFDAAGTAQTLTLADAQAVGQLPHVLNWSPLVNASEQVVYGDQNWNTSVRGVYPDFQSIQNWQIAEGAWFSDEDEQMGTPVAVLGQTVVENLFSDSTVDPVGQNIRINTDIFRVVGVLQSKGAQGAANADDVIFVPFSAASERLKPSQYVNQIQLQVDDINNVSQVQLEATALLRQRHHLIGPDPALTQQNGGTTTRNFSSLGGGGGGAFFRRNGNGGGAASSTGARGRNSRVTAQPDDFQVLNVNQVIQTAQQNSAVLTTLLIGIAAISLTVGGIGIMNIMLVSVTERVREIGIMMAVGARQRDVLHQFLLEALLLSVVGGLIGIVIGVLIGFALTVGLGFPFVVSLIPIVVAFGVSAIVGVTFGFYPAMRASRLDPILALHSE